MIRHAKVEDADSCIHLMKLVKNDFPGYREDAFRTALLEMIEKGEVFVSKDDGMLEGMVGFSREKKELTLLAVHPDCRREGIATRLIYTVAGCFEPEDEISVIAHGDEEEMEELKGFYHSCGFEDDDDIISDDPTCQRMVYRV